MGQIPLTANSPKKKHRNSHARGFISPDYAHRIARLAPDDADVQQQAIGALVQDGKGIQEAENSANIYREIRDSQSGELMFDSDQQEEVFNRFLAKYAANKIREKCRKSVLPPKELTSSGIHLPLLL